LEYDTRQNEITTYLLNDITDYFSILLGFLPSKGTIEPK